MTTKHIEKAQLARAVHLSLVHNPLLLQHSSDPDLYCLESCKYRGFGNTVQLLLREFWYVLLSPFSSLFISTDLLELCISLLSYTSSVTHRFSAGSCQLAFFSLCSHR